MNLQTENRAGQEVGKGTIDPLFDAEVRYRPDMAPVVSAEGREGGADRQRGGQSPG